MGSTMVEKIIAYESGEMNAEEVEEFFAELVSTGTIWHLQGHYQRTAMAMGLI